MAYIGSSFLGDSHRRFLNSSTPPSSPPASVGSGSGSARMATLSPPISPLAAEHVGAHSHLSREPVAPPAVIDPELSLELRLRWLEALLVGQKQDKKPAPPRKGKGQSVDLKQGVNLARAVEDIQTRLNSCVEGSDGLRRFMDQYDQHAHYLTPAFALSGLFPDAPGYEDMTESELDVLLGEMEADVRAADRDLREIEALEQKGVLEAGRLAEHEGLQPRLDTLLKAQEEDLQLAASLEKRVANLMENHTIHVDALSELFVDWDEALSLCEDKLSSLEKDGVERRRLGFD